MRWQILAGLALALACTVARGAAGQATTPDDPGRVLILYDLNEADGNGNGVGDSLEIALTYARVRGVPTENLLGLKVSTAHFYYSGTNAWTDFWNDILGPLQAKLNAVGTGAIDTLLVSYGVPYRITVPGVSSHATRAIDNLIAIPFSVGGPSGPAVPGSWWTNPYFETSPSRPPDMGRFSHATHSFSGKPLYLVSRLDGPDVHAARELIEGARYGERYFSPQPGYHRGFGYIDTRYGKYSSAFLDGYPFGYSTYQTADQCMAFGQRFVQAAGLPLKWEPTGAEIGEAGAVYHDNTPALTAPNALFYAGWYNYNRYLDVWDWLPGSVACDLNSNSIQNLHTTTSGTFLPSAFRRGLTAGAGVIAEPYLTGHHRPEVLLYFVLNGYTFAEAACLSNPALAWVSVQMGDPLYAPTRAGRTPIQDKTPPPPPRLAVTVKGNGDADVIADLDTFGREPDLVTMKVDYGVDRAMTRSEDHDKVYRVRKTVPLTSLAPDSLYYYRTEVRDPAGLTTASLRYVFFSTPAAPVRTHVAPAVVQVKRNQNFSLDIVYVVNPDLTSLDGWKVELIDPQKITYDITFLIYYAIIEANIAAERNTIALHVLLPAVLPAGSYTIKSTVTSGTNLHTASATVTIQP
jgi:uncharacterized protein (TIGR03790 family)